LIYIATSTCKGQPTPEREWAVRDRILARAVTLLSGDGGVGKSILALHLGIAAVLGRDWLAPCRRSGPCSGSSAKMTNPRSTVAWQGWSNITARPSLTWPTCI